MARALLAVLAAVCVLAGCGGNPNEGKVRSVIYWEKWTDFEGAAIDRVVDAFNAKERAKAQSTPGYVPIEVKKVTFSQIDQKLLVATAGGNPPDVAGSYSGIVGAFADKGALTDLGPYAKAAGIDRSRYIEHFYDISVYKGKLWALPTTPATVALHWNKRLFSESGFDPDKPPKTIAELDAMAEKMTKWEVTLPSGKVELRSGYLLDVPEDKKRLKQIGFLPSEPGWWPWGWGYFFGGDLMDGDKVTANSPENLRAYEWVASYSKNLGVDAVQRFRSGFGNFSSPQNPFLSGKVAMEIQGVWMYNFISKYAPGMQWAAAPFPPPADMPDMPPVTNAEADVLVIPKDSKHPEEAFAFIEYVESQEGMEMLCAGQKKFSPLKEVTEGFWKKHENPYIRMFRDLSLSPNAFSAPQIGVWNEYSREFVAAVDVIQNLTKTPKQALDEAQIRSAAAVDRDRIISARRAE